MEQFIEHLEKSKTKQKGRDRMDKRREFFIRVLSFVDHPHVKILDPKPCSEEGDIRFEVLISDIGFSYGEFGEYKALIFVPYAGNFIGELIVRENISTFAEIIVGISSEEYAPLVQKTYDHKNFGIEIYRNRIIFSFHISLLQSILTEDFEKQLKRKLNS